MVSVSDVSVKILKRELLECLWFVELRVESELIGSVEEKVKCDLVDWSKIP
jgi:hypothetical protein